MNTCFKAGREPFIFLISIGVGDDMIEISGFREETRVNLAEFR